MALKAALDTALATLTRVTCPIRRMYVRMALRAPVWLAEARRDTRRSEANATTRGALRTHAILPIENYYFFSYAGG